jgi:sporulation protein YlmC with PRC-barrel domain
MLIGLILNLAFYSSAPVKGSEKEAKFVLKVKNELANLGTGKETNVKVKLRDNRKVSGYVSEIGAENFTVVEKKTNQAVQIPYSQVKKVKGKNSSTGEKIWIGIGIAWFVLAMIAMITTDDF